MTPQQLLNADMATIGRWVRQGLSWWGNELADLIPPAIRRRRTRAPRWQVEMSVDGVARLWRDGAPAGMLDTAGGGMRAADLLLPSGVALVRDLDLPRLSTTDLHRLVELNIDRYTPFAAEQVYFDTKVLERPTEGATQRVRLGVIPRDRGKALLGRATDLGVKVERMGLGGGPDGRTIQFDFMRAIRTEEGGDPTRRRRLYLWAACAVLAAANVGVAVLRDSNDVGQLQRLVDTQQPAAAMALKLRRTVEAERGRRLALLSRRSAHEPLRILDAATRALPAGQWVQRLEWNGRAVRLVGFKKPGFDVPAALRGPALGDPHSLTSDMPTKAASGLEPFDVLADASGRSRR